MRKAVKKLRSRRGESLVESLIAMLIITLAGLMLAGSVVSSARVNAGARDFLTFPRYAGDKSNGSANATLSWEGGNSVSLGTVTVYESKGGMVYYE